MLAYIARRLLLIVPTLLGIMTINFFIVQAAPGGPVERTIAELKGRGVDATERFTGGTGDSGQARGGSTGTDASGYRGARGLPPELIKEIERLYGFDKPPIERFLGMLGNYATFDFGKSLFSDRSVLGLIRDKMPVSITLGLWTTLLIYVISIPLGIAKAVRDGSRFDLWTSVVLVVTYSIPSFLFAILLVVVFAGGSYLSWFPLRGLTSENWENLSLAGKTLDYLWHICLPILAMVIGGFASLAMLTKNSFMNEIGKQYVVTAHAKGLSDRGVLYGHVFRNAMLLVVAGFPAAFIGILFSSSLLIEVIFSLDGLGQLGFDAVVNRDYPIVFGTLYIFTLMGLILRLLGDLMYVVVDPRIDFEKR